MNGKLVNVQFRQGDLQFHFFNAFDASTREFEDQLQSEKNEVKIETVVSQLSHGSLPWPRISFWQGYRYLQSLKQKYFVVQMIHLKSGRRYQLSVLQHQSKIKCFSWGIASYWIPCLQESSQSDQMELLKVLPILCRQHSSMMSVHVHCYVPGDSSLALMEKSFLHLSYVQAEPYFPQMTRLIDLRSDMEDILNLISKKTQGKLKIKKPDEIKVEKIVYEASTKDLQQALNESFLRSSNKKYNFDFDGLFETQKKFPASVMDVGLYFRKRPSELMAFVLGVKSASLFEYSVAGSKSDAELRLFPFNYILLWKLIEEAKAQGSQVFDMGGITDESAQDPLAGISNFKRRFPGFDISVGKEMKKNLRPLRSVLFLALQQAKNLLRKNHF